MKRQEEREQDTITVTDTATEDTTKLVGTNVAQDGWRFKFQKHFSLIIFLLQCISMLNDTFSDTMTGPRLTIKGQKWAVAQFLETSAPSLKQLEYSSYFLAYVITQPIKTKQSTAWNLVLAFWDWPHSVYGMYISRKDLLLYYGSL